MTAQPGKYQANFNGGEYGPELHGRVDLKQYYSGAAYMLNVEPVPQGGFKLSPRTAHIALTRNIISIVVPSSATPNLGPHTVAATIYTLTFSVPVTIAIARLSALTATQAVGSLVRAEYLDPDNVTWRPIGPAAGFSADTTPRTRTAAQPPGSSVTTTSVRLRLTANPPSATTFGVSAFTVYAETGNTPSGHIVRSFAFSKDQTYEVVLTDDHIDVWRDDVFVGAAASSWSGALIAELDLQQRFDSMIIFHNDLTPQRLLRDGADHEWDVRPLSLTGMPQVDYGGTYPQVTDEWQFTLTFPTDAVPFRYGINLLVSFTVNGEETATVSTSDDGSGNINTATFLPGVTAALEAKPSVGTGITVTTSSYVPTSGFAVFNVAFTGVDNNGEVFALSARVVNTGAAAANTAHTVIGSTGGEDLMSVARGWPGCGLFWQDRLIQAGFEAKKGAFLASRTGEYFNIDTTVANASAALLANLDTDGSERIVRLARSLHLLLFTTAAEYFIVDRALSRTTNPNVVETSRNGIVPTIPVCKAEDQLFYVAADKADVDSKGVLIYAAEYSDVAQRYVSQPISLLASHIASDIVDASMQVFSKPTAASRYFLVRADGTMTIGIMIRGQDVTGFVRWQTDGPVLSSCVNGKNVPYLLVKRAVGTTVRIMLERMREDLLFDGAVTVTNAPASETVSGLTMHNSQVVWAIADGYVLGPFIVVDSTITLPFAASSITVGRWTPPRVLTLPVPRIIQDTTVLARPVRVHTIRGNVIGTTSLAIGANGNRAKDVTFYRGGSPTDAPLAPYSGKIEIGGLTDYTETGTVEITQLRPGALQVRELIVEART